MIKWSFPLRQNARPAVLLASLICCVGLLLAPARAAAEGSGTLYPSTTTTGRRANVEWRNSTYGPTLKRRTLFKVYADAGEYILLGSSAVNAPIVPPVAQGGNKNDNQGDILVYDNKAVTGPIGSEVLPAASFSCLTQRAATGNINQGRIGSRATELAGPDAINNAATATAAGQVAGGYTPCFYQAPAQGIYDVVFLGPSGADSNAENNQSSAIGDDPRNFNSVQQTSVAVWDVTVRTNLADATTTKPGRLFTYYLAALTGGNGNPVQSDMYIVTKDGFRYRINGRGSDPYGWISYANEVGFLDSDGTTPLYHDVLAVPTLGVQAQNQLFEVQGGVSLALPEFPMFVGLPDDAALTFLNIPTTAIPPSVIDLAFAGIGKTNVTTPGKGGTFSFNTNVAGTYEFVISRDGINFDPTKPENRVYRKNLAVSGAVTIIWDGLDNAGVEFPVGDQYKARTSVHGGEVHFPSLDVENSIAGGPEVELLNSPGTTCFAFNGRCTGAFYDDRGYQTANSTLVGTAINGPLCAANTGLLPNPLVADAQTGYDSAGTERSFGFPTGGNSTTAVCDPVGGFGDKKGLDKWTYYPANAFVPLRIVAPEAVELASFTAQRTASGVDLRWATAAEANTRGFYLLRSDDGTRAAARRVSPTLILATGSAGSGASYHLLDSGPQSGSATRYWLQEVETGGQLNEYGPVTPANAVAQTGNRVYIPWVGGIR